MKMVHAKTTHLRGLWFFSKTIVNPEAGEKTYLYAEKFFATNSQLTKFQKLSTYLGRALR